MSRKRERENPCFICNHYHNFEAGELCTVCGHGPAATVERAPPPSAFPTLVVPDMLYLGSYDHAARAELLKALGVKRILNVRAPCAPRGKATRSPQGQRRWGACASARAARRAETPRLPAQTVPDCQNLYKNTFLYHSASAVPDAPKHVPLDECVAFIGAPTAPGGRAAPCAPPARATPPRGRASDARLHSHRAPPGFDVPPRARAEASLMAQEPVLVHCMSGSSRCAPPAPRAAPRCAHTAHASLALSC